MKRLSGLLALWFFSPITVQANEEPVSLKEPIVIQSNETFNGEGKRFSSCEHPAFQLEGTGAVLENVEIEQCERTTVSAVLVVGLGHQVIDVTIEATGTGIAVENSYGVRLIRPNVTGKGEEEGIAIEDSEATVIKGAIVDHVRDGIYIENGTGHELTRPLVTNSRYGESWALHPLDGAIDSGQVVALCGSNGAGKSTLLNLMNGTIPPSVGSVSLNGRTIDEGKAYHRTFGYMPDDLRSIRLGPSVRRTPITHYGKA